MGLAHHRPVDHRTSPPAADKTPTHTHQHVSGRQCIWGANNPHVHARLGTYQTNAVTDYDQQGCVGELTSSAITVAVGDAPHTTPCSCSRDKLVNFRNETHKIEFIHFFAKSC
jgi:hypothetical protein